ncbi:MAG: class I SAM-dependent methyltransferase [Candidatus Omnitrophota bacterium]
MNFIKYLLRKSAGRAKCLRARSWRPQWLPPWVVLQTENSVHPHMPEEHADLFLAYNASSTEIETLHWLHATSCLIKPKCILETGVAEGLGTIALAAACKANGFGKVHSIEIDSQRCITLNKLLDKEKLSEFVVVHRDDSRDFLRTTNLNFDLAYFDSLCEIRAEEYTICRQRDILKGIAVFHDTAPLRTQTLASYPPEPLHSEYRRQIHELVKQPGVTGYFESTLSRGLVAIFLEGKSEGGSIRGIK